MEQSGDLTTFSKPPEDQERIFLSLGSNLGGRFERIAEAIGLLGKRDVRICCQSAVYETQPVEVVDQPDFLNLCCEVKTLLDPEGLIDTCLSIEEELGRQRIRPKGPRAIDIDILFYGQRIFRSSRLSIPHPALPRRRFVLVPMAEIAPEFRDPVSELTICQLLRRCPDRSSVQVLNRFQIRSDSSDL